MAEAFYPELRTARWREPVVVLRQTPVINHDLVRRSLAPRPPSAMWAKLEPAGARAPGGEG
jgi:hypothetical protein